MIEERLKQLEAEEETANRGLETAKKKVKMLSEKLAGIQKEKKELEETCYTLRIGNVVKEIVGQDMDLKKIKGFLYYRLMEDPNGEEEMQEMQEMQGMQEEYLDEDDEDDDDDEAEEEDRAS